MGQGTLGVVIQLVTLLSLGFNVIILIVQSRVKADLATLRGEIFEKFLTKEDYRNDRRAIG